MRVRYQADADLKQTIVSSIWRHEPGIDFHSASEANLSGKLDPEVLAVCSAAGCVLVTHDARTMPRHFAEFILQETSPGVLIVPQSMPVAAAVEELILIWATTNAAEWVNRICRLPL